MMGSIEQLNQQHHQSAEVWGYASNIEYCDAFKYLVLCYAIVPWRKDQANAFTNIKYLSTILYHFSQYSNVIEL